MRRGGEQGAVVRVDAGGEGEAEAGRREGWGLAARAWQTAGRLGGWGVRFGQGLGSRRGRVGS